MFRLVKVLIGRNAVSLDRSFDYRTSLDTVHAGERVFVPFGGSKKTIGFVLEEPEIIDRDIKEYEQENEIKLAEITEVVDSEPLLSPELIELAKRMADYYKTDLIKVLSTFLPPSLKPRDSALNKPQAKYVDFVFAIDKDPSLLSKTEETLYRKIKNEKDGIRKTEIGAKITLSKLIDKGYAKVEPVQVSRIPQLVAGKMQNFVLTDEQTRCLSEIKESEDRTVLLEGVTGSGKTEIYMQLGEEYLKKGYGVLILIPEIALTDQTAYRFSSFFKDTISILNSSLSDSRKYDEYTRIRNGETKIVLGTRSAIFAPVQNLGLIIIDEEHSSSYKQDNAPFYDARQVALMRRDLEGCKVLLGSATPRIVDRAKADRGIYRLVTLSQRFALNQDKDLIMVNMNESAAFDPRKSSLISNRLFTELERTISNHEQAMVLINRRGYSPFFMCNDCSKALICPNCGIPLNYHKRDNTVRCHHCGYQINAAEAECPDCHSHKFYTLGYGTERAAEDIQAFLPDARILRLDSDITGNEKRHSILRTFADGDADVLVGTQVIAKGHDFKNVTLAAMLDADSSLRLPTYLANEETFDLISQFVGRSGRDKKKGTILIQTYNPENEVISLASRQDYESFYSMEMAERRMFQYPPYVYLAKIVVKALDDDRCEDVSYLVKNDLVSKLGNKRINIYGPSKPYIPHINGRYYRHILLKYKSPDELNLLLKDLKLIRLANKDVEIVVDIDPSADSI